MPMGKGTYGSKVGRPKKSLLSKKQETLPTALKRKILKKKAMKNGGK